MSRKVLLIFSGVFALVVIILFSYLKYNVEIPGDKIFQMRFDWKVHQFINPIK